MLTDRRPLPDPGSDEARAGVAEGYGVGCECPTAANGVQHPTAGHPVDEHHGHAVKDVDGWVIAGDCPMHTSDAWRDQDGDR